MDRMTYKTQSGAANLHGVDDNFDMIKISAAKQKAFDRLAAYEDTGLMPDEIPHWIPVSERLPAESEYREKDTGELIPILVCVKGTKYPFRAMYDDKTWGDGIGNIDVTYWQPLSQPPKGENS